MLKQPNVIHNSSIIAKYVLETNMQTKVGIYAIYAKYMIDLYENVYTYEVTAINHVTVGTVHIFDMYH